MPQKKPPARRTSEATTRKPPRTAGAPAPPPPRRSPRLLPTGERRGGAPPAATALAATPRRRSPRLLSQRVDYVGLAEEPSGSGRRKGEHRPGAPSSPRPRLRRPKIPCGSVGAARSEETRAPGMEEPCGRHVGRSRNVSSGFKGLRRSLRVSKSGVVSGGGFHLDATGGGGDAEGGWRRRSARLTVSAGKESIVDAITRSGSDRKGKSRKMVVSSGSTLWASDHERECGKDVPSVGVAMGIVRAEVGSVVSEESGDNVIKTKKKKRDTSVVSGTPGGRDKKSKRTTETPEQLDPKRGGVESGSASPGWTIEQEVALHKAYILAKPSPHFWKKVSKMVPGKSAQECFDRMHSKIVTPVPLPPRSRAKKVDFSPLGFSDFYKKNDRRTKSSKKRSLLAHKTVRHILRKHSVMDQGQAADLFSVLETSPNLYADCSQIINVPWNPEYVMGSPELFPKSSDLSSSHKKMFSRLRSQILANHASPEVLKPVKNIELHEKYIDQLHCREARRKMYAKAACSVSSEDDKENHVLKGNVKTATDVLISEAKEIIFQFGHTQATPLSNSEDTDGSVDDNEEDA